MFGEGPHDGDRYAHVPARGDMGVGREGRGLVERLMLRARAPKAPQTPVDAAHWHCLAKPPGPGILVTRVAVLMCSVLPRGWAGMRAMAEQNHSSGGMMGTKMRKRIQKGPGSEGACRPACSLQAAAREIIADKSLESAGCTRGQGAWRGALLQ